MGLRQVVMALMYRAIDVPHRSLQGVAMPPFDLNGPLLRRIGLGVGTVNRSDTDLEGSGGANR